MCHWFEKLDAIIEREGFVRTPFVPKQPYCCNENETIIALNTLFSEHLKCAKSALVFVDGVEKLASHKKTIDAVFREITSATGIETHWHNISSLLNVQPENLHASHKHVSKIREVLRNSQCGVAITLGSGTLTDLVKHALYEENSDKKLVSVPTAISVTAYTSAFSVLDWNGAKRTKPSRNVNAVLWVEPFVANAPHRMTQAGYGDLLAPFWAYGDWALANAFGLAPNYNIQSFRLLEPFFDGIKQCAHTVGTGTFNSETMECLCASLGMAGIGMSAAGETAPFSGCEHAVSHGLDFLRTTSGRTYVLHGEQVALASLTSAALFDWFLNTPRPDIRKWRTETPDEMINVLNVTFDAAPFWGEQEFLLSQIERNQKLAAIEPALSAARAEFIADYRKKAEIWHNLAGKRQQIAQQWYEIQNTVRNLTMRGDVLEALLKNARLPLSPEETFPKTTPMELRWAARFSPFVRSRASIADVVFWMGEDPVIISGL